MRSKRETITQMRLYRISVCSFEINSEPHRFIICLNKRDIWIIVLMLGEDNFVPISLRKCKNFWKKMYLKNFRNYLCIRGYCVNIFENINKSFDRPLTIITTDVIS